MRAGLVKRRREREAQEEAITAEQQGEDGFVASWPPIAWIVKIGVDDLGGDGRG